MSLAFLTGCPAGPPDDGKWSEQLQPQRIAVVETARFLDVDGGSTVELTFKSGEAIERDLNAMDPLEDMNSPGDGVLWIEGNANRSAWYATARVEGECFTLFDQGQDLGDTVWFSSGLVLPKATGCEAGLPSLNMQSGVRFCLNQFAEVVSASL
jgi:hypothetical protein